MTRRSPVNIRLVQPSAPLRGLISGYYAADIDSPVPIEDHTVPEWGSIRIIEAGGWTYHALGDQEQTTRASLVQGPTSRPFRFVLQQCRLFGIGLLPEAFCRFWDVDVSLIADKVVPLEQILGEDAPAFEAGLLAQKDFGDRFVHANLFFESLLAKRSASKTDFLVRRLRELINDPAISRTDQLAENLSVSQSTLATICRLRFGYPPKLLLRRQRFLRVLEALHARPYSDWPDFFDPSYTDQSHMISDFRYFMGMSPSQYMALPRIVQQQSAIERTHIKGRALQGLE